MMNFFISHLFLVSFVSFVNAAIIIQAPKYVQKKALESLVMQYYDQLRGIKAYAKKGIEIEIPIRPPTYFINSRRMGKIPINSMSRRKHKSTKLSKSFKIPMKTMSRRKHKSTKLSKSFKIRMNTMSRRKHKSTKLKSHAMPARSPVVKPVQILIKTSPPATPASIPTRAIPSRTIQSLPLPLQKIMLVRSAPVMHQAYAKSKVMATGLKDLYARLGNDNLKRAEEQVEKLLRANGDINKRILVKRRSGGDTDGKNVIYQEDVEKALKELEERLLASERGEHAADSKPRPATLDDLMKAIAELEKNIMKHKEILATSTPDPCGEEKILHDALQPALQEDLRNLMKLTKYGGSSHNVSRRVLGLTLKNPDTSRDSDSDTTESIDNENAQRSFSEELADMFQGDINQSGSISSPTLNNSRRYIEEKLIDIIKDGVDVDENPKALEDKGLIPIKIEIPKMYQDIIIKTD